MRRLVFALLALVLLAGGASHAFAQGFTGGIRGAIKDSGGVIPGAEVTLTNEATNVSRSTTSNEAGEYTFPNLAPGTYTLKVDPPGIQDLSPCWTRRRHAAVPDARHHAGGRRARGDDHRHRPGAAHRDLQRLDRHDAEHRDDGDAAVGGPHRVHDGHHGADGHPVGRRAVQPPAGSDQRRA